jgi:large subunit ribosomal protein L21
MYAIIEFKGKQYKAEKGKLLKVDLLENEAGDSIDIDSVLLVSKGGEGEGGEVSVGTPYVSGAKVKAKVESHGKDKKIIVFKYMPKKDYRRKMGHRQKFSVIKVEEIEA